MLVFALVPSLAQGQAAKARRSAAALSASPARTKVERSVGELAEWVRSQKGRVSAQVVDAETGEAWAQASAKRSVNPASNMKLVTAAVALSELGPQYRYTTALYGRIESARVESLVLRGHGDPSLEVGDLHRLVLGLTQRGVRHVGRVLVDQSRFDDQFVPPAFEQQPHEWASFRAPVSAIAVDRNAVTLHVEPTRASESAQVWFEPPGAVSIAGTVATRPAGSGQAVHLVLSPRPQGLHAKVSGHVAQGLPHLRFPKRLDDPRLVPGSVLRYLLQQAGVEVSGPVELGGTQEHHRLVAHRSEPLSVLLLPLGKRSDNFYAEMLLKTLASESGHTPATSAQGSAIVTRWLEGNTSGEESLQVVNGSGLFDADRLSASTLVGVLMHMVDSPTLYPEFAAQLSIGGVDGTLRSRFARVAGHSRVRAKTGTLARAIALSGYVLRPDGRRPLVFSLLVDGIAGRAWAIRRKMDAVVVALLGQDAL